VAKEFGAAAAATSIQNKAEDEGWKLAQYFKLHLHPTTMRAAHNIVVPPLPHGVTLDQVYADFFRYLYNHTEAFFKDRELSGPEIWGRLERQGNIEFVLAHPNGWGPHEQKFLRDATIKAGIVSASLASEKVSMVSEAEASVHFLMLYGNMETRLEVGDFVLRSFELSRFDITRHFVTA
jgi:hypothetical protein